VTLEYCELVDVSRSRLRTLPLRYRLQLGGCTWGSPESACGSREKAMSSQQRTLDDFFAVPIASTAAATTRPHCPFHGPGSLAYERWSDGTLFVGCTSWRTCGAGYHGGPWRRPLQPGEQHEAAAWFERLKRTTDAAARTRAEGICIHCKKRLRKVSVPPRGSSPWLTRPYHKCCWDKMRRGQPPVS
jgi:hypothetical protein